MGNSRYRWPPTIAAGDSVMEKPLRAAFDAIRPRATRTNSIFCPTFASGGLSGCRDDHPRHAETVGGHAEFRREERLAKRHLHLPALRQRAEHTLGFGIVRRFDRQ